VNFTINDVARTHPYFLPYRAGLQTDCGSCKCQLCSNRVKNKEKKMPTRTNGVGYPVEHSCIPDAALQSPIIDAMKREKEIQFSEVRRKLALRKRMELINIDDRNDPPAL
jgi:hypothetical protein